MFREGHREIAHPRFGRGFVLHGKMRMKTECYTPHLMQHATCNKHLHYHTESAAKQVCFAAVLPRNVGQFQGILNYCMVCFDSLPPKASRKFRQRSPIFS